MLGGSTATGVYSCINGTNGRIQADCTNATFYGDTRKVRGVGERRFFYSVGSRGLANNYYPDFITLMKIKQGIIVTLSLYLFRSIIFISILFPLILTSQPKLLEFFTKMLILVSLVLLD